MSTASWPSQSLHCHGLAVARAGVAVLEGLDLHLKGGQALVLRGPNGSGKTTLLRTLAGLQPALRGTTQMPPECLTYAAHADGLKTVLSVAENLQFWAKVHGHDDIGPALVQMNLGSLAARRAADLSAGQKRRLGLARLLVTGRWLWLLDEPTVSLDTASVALFGQMLRGHLGQGGAAIIASHIDLGLTAEVQDLDLSQYRARANAPGRGGFDEAFT